MGDLADVEAIRRHFGFERISLVGYSYLGLMVALYARDHPDRVERLVQIGAVPRKFGTPYPADQVADLSTLSAEAMAAVNEGYAAQNRHLGAHFEDIQKREFEREAFTKLPHPVLTIHGTLDRNAPYGGGLEWATTFPNARLITVSGGAHQLWLDDPSVIADIDLFLDGKWPARAQQFGRE